MEKVTLFSHILPEEQERMWICFQMREIVYENHRYYQIRRRQRSQS